MNSTPIKMKTTIGMVTVSQAPRDDIVPQMAAMIDPEISIIQEGTLNGLSGIEIEALAPEPTQVPLCTRISDGRQVILSKEKILPLIQTKIDTLNRRKVDLILLLCTDQLPHKDLRLTLKNKTLNNNIHNPLTIRHQA